VATKRMTLAQVTAAAARRTPDEEAAFQRRMDATTEADIRRYMVEDGEDPADPDVGWVPVVHAQAVRRKLGLSQSELARLLAVPVATLRNWEQNRYSIEPAVRTLLRLIDHEPEAALRALRRPPHAA
jgi:putative transcriptional regulator